MDEAISGSAEAEDGENQEGDCSSERKARRTESEGRKTIFYLFFKMETKETKKDHFSSFFQNEILDSSLLPKA